jgi:hypothetical protein
VQFVLPGPLGSDDALRLTFVKLRAVTLEAETSGGGGSWWSPCLVPLGDGGAGVDTEIEQGVSS